MDWVLESDRSGTLLCIDWLCFVNGIATCIKMNYFVLYYNCLLQKKKKGGRGKMKKKPFVVSVHFGPFYFTRVLHENKDGTLYIVYKGLRWIVVYERKDMYRTTGEQLQP